MHFTIDRKALADTGAWVAAAISRNPDTPALAGMLIEARADSVRLTGFDGDTTHTADVPAAISTEGTALASGRFLVSIAAALAGETVEIEYADPFLTIKAGRSKYRIQCAPVADYPAVPTMPKHVGTIAAESFGAALGIVEHAVSKEATLRAMTAVNIVGSAGHLTLTSTDRYRIAQARANWADASGVAFEANIPAVALTTAIKGLIGDVEIGQHEGAFGIASKSRAIVTRTLAEGEKFPKLAPIFDREPVLHVEAETPAIIEALKRAQLVQAANALVRVEFSDSLIRVSADGASSDGTEEIETDPGFGEAEMVLKFNAAYLGQALAASPFERVRFGLIEPSKQMLVTPLRPTARDGVVAFEPDDSCRLIVMPRGRE